MTYWLNQANLTTREQLDNCEWLADGKGEGDTLVLWERDRYRAFRRWAINHLRSEKEMGPSKLSKRLLGPLLADGQVPLATIPETTADRTPRLQFLSHILSGEYVPQGILFYLTSCN